MFRGRPQHFLYLQAVRSFLDNPVCERDAWIKAFVKVEKILFDDKVEDIDDYFDAIGGDDVVHRPLDSPDPRIIQPRSPRFNVAVGRYIKPIEGRVYGLLQELFHEVVVMKGFNAVEIGELAHKKWMRFDEPVALGLDASRFDQHVSVDALRFEHKVYQMFYPGNSELKRLLSWQLKNVGRAFCPDGRVKYQVNGCRMSGDMNTGLGNCLLMCSMIYHHVVQQGIKKVSLLNNGDDAVVIVEQRDLAKLQQNLVERFASLGFTMKVEEPVYRLEELEFCQMHPVFDGTSWQMVRNMTCLDKDLLSSLRISNEREWNNARFAISACGMAYANHLPVLGSFYRMLQRGSFATKLQPPRSGFEFLVQRLRARGDHITVASRVSFWRAFGILPDMQRALEERYDTTTMRYCDPHVNSKL